MGDLGRTRGQEMLFHLHLFTPNWIESEQEYCRDFGFSVYGRFGFQGERWSSEIGWDELARRNDRVRLTELVAGRVSLVLGPAAPNRKPFMEHIGLVMPMAQVDAAAERAVSMGWKVSGRGERRLFVLTPFGYRVELAPHEVWLERWGDAPPHPAMTEVVLAHSAPEEGTRALATVLGYDASGSQIQGPGLRITMVPQEGRAGVLVGYRLTTGPDGPREDPCGALVWGSEG